MTHKISQYSWTVAYKSFQRILEWWWQWWLMALILERQRQEDLWIQDQLGIQSKFQKSQDYTEKPCPKKTKQKNNNKHITTPSDVGYPSVYVLHLLDNG